MTLYRDPLAGLRGQIASKRGLLETRERSLPVLFRAMLPERLAKVLAKRLKDDGDSLEDLARVDATLSGMADVIKAYFIGRSIISAIFATFTFLLLTVLHLPYAVVFAVLAFFFGAIPNIGSMLATVLPALIALAYKGITTALIVAGALLGYQQLENNLIQPQIQKRTVKVPPVLTVIGVLFGSSLLGLLGAIIAIPTIAAALAIAEEWSAWTRGSAAITGGLHFRMATQAQASADAIEED